MARTKDREFVAEALRLGDIWRVSLRSERSLVLNTDCDEQLEIYYGNVGQIRFAEYMHWDRDTGETVYREDIKLRKRERVLQLLCASRNQNGRLTVRNRSGYQVNVGSIADGWDNYKYNKKKVS